MDEAVHESHRQRSSHWWFRARQRIFGAVLERWVDLPAGQRILDVGPGSGIHLPLLSPLGSVTVVDRDRGSARACLGREVSVTQGNAEQLPFRAGQFELTCALDVLEHLDDDRAGLAELYRVTAPGGHLLLSVPAWTFLWGRQDILSHHKRRYRRAPLQARLLDAGFEVRRLTYFNFLLFPPILALRILGRPFLGRCEQTGRTDFDVRAPFGLEELLFRLFASESRWIPRHNLPFGVSLLALVRRPENVGPSAP